MSDKTAESSSKTETFIRSKYNLTQAQYNNQAFRSFLAGAGAGVCCTLFCAPLDVAKVRLQIQGSLGLKTYNGNIISTIHKIYTEEGLKGTFKGVGPALLTVPLFWGVYWPIYDTMKRVYGDEFPTLQNPYVHILSAVTAGAISDVITNPFWVTRTRIQTALLHKNFEKMRISQGGLQSMTSQTYRDMDHSSTWQMMSQIYKEEGLRAFYKGLGASFLGLSHTAIQFPIYEYLKTWMKSHRSSGGSEDLTISEIITASITAKLIASTLTYPHEVLRARLQDERHISKAFVPIVHPKASRLATDPSIQTTVNQAVISRAPGLWKLLMKIVSTEGISALYSGLQVNMFRVIPATITTFVSYEYFSKRLLDVYPPPNS